MQNPLFKCTKNVTYHLPLHEKRSQANFKTKRNFNYNRKYTSAKNQWYAGQRTNILRQSGQPLEQVFLMLYEAVHANGKRNQCPMLFFFLLFRKGG